MPTITLASQTIEVYADVADANAYMNTVFHGAPWLAADSKVRAQALVTATHVFERTKWLGTPTQPIDKTQPQPPSTQPLAWPRTGLIDRDGVAVPSATIPLDIVNGNIEYALALINDATVQTSENTGSNTRRTRSREKVDVIETESEIEYFLPTLRTASKFPTIIQQLIGIYLASASRGTQIYAGGTDVEPESGADFGYTGSGYP